MSSIRSTEQAHQIYLSSSFLSIIKFDPSFFPQIPSSRFF
jgi:hypothetical protein